VQKKLKLSNSQVSTFLRCPKQWYYRYVKGLKIPPSGAMLQGTAYHGALNEYFKVKIEHSTELSIDDTLDAFDMYWNDGLKGVYDDRGKEDTKMEISWDGNNPGELKDEAANMVKLYHRRIAPNVEPVKTEGYAEKDLGDGLLFIGYIDLETPTELIDHKLKGKMISQMEANRDTQPTSYAMLTGKDSFSFHVAVKKRIPEIGVVKVKKTADDVIWWENAIRDIASQMNAGIFPPNPTNWTCSEKFCGYWHLCKGKS
jgi:CRISPR/Cas system-associated exonuclease Cas4 (RecB family)